MKGVSRKFQGRYKNDFRMLDGCFNGVLSGIQECLKEVEWVFEGSFKDVSRMFQERLRGVPKVL